MRVLIACPYAIDLPGGVQVHVRDLAGQLRARGHEVRVLAPVAGIEPEGVMGVGGPVRVAYAGTVAPIAPFCRRRVRLAMQAFGPDVVHVHEPYVPSASLHAVRTATAPVVATFHAYLEGDRAARVAAKLLLRGVGRRIDARIAVSHAAADHAAAFDGGEVEIIPNGVDVGRFARPGAEAELDGARPRRIAWVNRLDPQKGFRVMVEAFGRIARELPDVELVVAGDGVDRGAIAALDAAIAPRVRMLGTVPHDRLPAHLWGADVLASPAIGQESFGIVLVEGMAAGLPVIATDIPGYREVVRDGVEGLLVPPADPGALADALRRVLTDSPLAGRLAAAGVERARGYAWDAVVPRIEQVYRRVVGGRAVAGR